MEAHTLWPVGRGERALLKALLKTSRVSLVEVRSLIASRVGTEELQRHLTLAVEAIESITP